ncbi:hypothetical protein, partial [Pseudomonas gingeri]|uniref:hypothetical protein n=1 Tax=Pseudomonas gingeri TaxID=117681 RepID=UPI001AE09F57
SRPRNFPVSRKAAVSLNKNRRRVVICICAAHRILYFQNYCVPLSLNAPWPFPAAFFIYFDHQGELLWCKQVVDSGG